MNVQKFANVARRRVSIELRKKDRSKIIVVA